MEFPVIKRFFKVMAPDFLTTLRLPPVISKKVAEANVNEAILITSKGAWKVSVGKNKDGLVCFLEGWDSFVKEHGLMMNDFAVFQHVGNMRFEVTMFGLSACEKEFSVGSKIEEATPLRRSDYDNIRSNKRGRPTKMFLSDEQNSRQFKKKIIQKNVDHAHPIMYFPSYFARANRISCNSRIILRGPYGKSEPLELKLHGNHSLCLSPSGWYKFYTCNKIKLGDDCLFKLNHNPAKSSAVVMDVQVFPAASP